MVFGGSWWFVVVLGIFFKMFLVVLGGSLRLFVILGVSWWLLGVLGGSLWSFVVLCG